MRGRQADGHNHVPGLLLLGRDSAVGDSVRAGRQVTLHIALVLHHPVYHIPAAVVRVHCVGTPGDRVIHRLRLQTVVLGHYHTSQHTPGLTHIKLGREVLVILVLIQRVAPLQEFCLDTCRHTLVCPKDIEQALGIVLVQLGYGVTLLIGSFRIIPAIANHIGGETSVIVVVGLNSVPTVRARRILHVSPLDAVAVTAPAFLLHPAEEQLILAGVVIIRHFIRNSTEGSVLGQCKTIVISLNVIVALALLAHRLRHDAPKKSAAGVAGHNIRVNPVAELMLVQALNTILGLPVLRGRLTTHRIRDAGTRHQVALVAAVDKDFGIYRPVRCHLGVGTVFQLYALHIITLLMGADDTPLIPDILIVLDAGIAQEPLEGSQRHLRLKVAGRRGHSVVMADTTVKLARETFYNTPVTGAVTYIRPAKTAGSHTAQTLGRRNQQHAFTLQLGRIGSHNAGRGTAVNTDIYIGNANRLTLLCKGAKRDCRKRGEKHSADTGVNGHNV